MSAVLGRAAGLPWLGIPAPRWLWLVGAFVPTALWLASPLASAVGPPFLDWSIYRDAFERWLATGSPYLRVEAGWDPFTTFPYLYPPSSWPLPVVAAALPPLVAWLGVLPLAFVRPPLVLVPVLALLLAIGLGDALYLANVNLIIAGLLVLGLRGGRAGGAALALAVALKAYPLILLPLVARDRRVLGSFAAILGGLLVTGTAVYGADGWSAWLASLIGQGAHPGFSLNPFGSLGPLRLLPAAAIALVGIRVRSATLALLGATLASGHVSDHYLITFAGPVLYDAWTLSSPSGRS